MSRPIQKFIDRMQAVLGPHDRANPPALLRELNVHLGRFSEEELQEAATILFATQKNKYWPTFGAMVVAAQQAREKLARIKSRTAPLDRPRIRNSIGEFADPRSKPQDEEYWSREAFREADKLIQSELGRKAADEGWIGDLYDFVRENRRLPNVNERYSLIKKSKKTDELFANERAGGPNRRLMATALNRRDHLAGVAYGKGSGWRWQEDNEAKIASQAAGVSK